MRKLPSLPLVHFGTLPAWWWLPISLLFVAVDTLTGNIIPPPVYVPLIMAAAWYSGRRVAVPMSVLLPLARLATVEGHDPQVGPARFVISVLVLVLMSLIGDRLAQHERELQARIQALETLLPMCMFCKGIRSGDQWQKLEHYMTDAGTHVTHGICPECAAREGWTV